MENTIWELKNPDGEAINTFDGFENLRVDHFWTLFRAQVVLSIAEIL